MTRDQAKAILQNLDLIVAFATGENCWININGHRHPTNSLCLGNFASDRGTNYGYDKSSIIVRPK